MKKWKNVALKCLTLGMWAEPFNRQEFSRKRFPPLCGAFTSHKDSGKDIAKALQDIHKFNVVNYEEAKRDVRVANIRSLVAVWIAIVSVIASIVVGLKGIHQSHEDSESTTRALVEAMSKIGK